MRTLLLTLVLLTGCSCFHREEPPPPAPAYQAPPPAPYTPPTERRGG
jgi:hypothetical protein